MKDWDYSYLCDALRVNKHQPPAATVAEATITIGRMVKEIQRLQSLLYLKSSEITTFGKYRMFRMDDSENHEGLLCLITQGPDNTFYLLGDGAPNDVECQNILTLDEEVRFLKV